MLRVNELYEDLGELEAGMVPRDQLHQKLSLMRQRLEDIEDALVDRRELDHSHIN